MDSQSPTQELRATCNQIAAHVTSMHPMVSGLEHPAARTEILKALFELTKQVEVVKKHLLKLEKGDSSTTL